MKKQPRIFFEMHRAHATLFRAADKQAMATNGLSSVQHGVLALLAFQDGATAGELANTLAMTKSSLSGLVDRMEKKQLLTRRTDGKDKRISHIHITETGRQLLAEADPLVRHVNSALLAPFNEAEQEIIGRFLGFLTDNADKILEDFVPGSPTARPSPKKNKDTDQ